MSGPTGRLCFGLGAYRPRRFPAGARRPYRRKRAAGSWDGYSGGDAPGLAFATLDWLHAHGVAAIATDAAQPWHWIAIPITGGVGSPVNPLAIK